MIKTDCHMHTDFSSDSDSSMESIIEGAIDLGLEAICITEHYDPCYPDNEDHLDFLLDFDGYEARFHKCKEKYDGRIQLYHGVELGVQNHISKECDDFIKNYGDRYDFILNSTHIVDSLDPYYGKYYPSFETPQKAVHHYFEVMLKNMDVFQDYQSLSHLDYILRYEATPRTPFIYSDYGEVIDAILSQLIARDKALEVNTAGWKYGMPDPNPNRQILSRYRELGGRMITIGSDGHKAAHLAYDYHLLPEFLKSLGFDSYLFYIEKKAHEIAI